MSLYFFDFITKKGRSRQIFIKKFKTQNFTRICQSDGIGFDLCGQTDGRTGWQTLQALKIHMNIYIYETFASSTEKKLPFHLKRTQIESV
jgi:hypothetical protein